MARVTKAILAASPNVVMLPTAAPRAVANNRYAEQRQAKDALRKAEPWPGGRRMFPGEHAARRTAETLCAITQTPELLMLCAILTTLDDDAREKVRAIARLYMRSESEVKRQAAAAIEASCPLNIGEQLSLSNALAYVTEGR